MITNNLLNMKGGRKPKMSKEEYTRWKAAQEAEEAAAKKAEQEAREQDAAEAAAEAAAAEAEEAAEAANRAADGYANMEHKLMANTYTKQKKTNKGKSLSKFPPKNQVVLYKEPVKDLRQKRETNAKLKKRLAENKNTIFQTNK